MADTNPVVNETAQDSISGGLPGPQVPLKITGGGKGQFSTISSPTGMLLDPESSAGVLEAMNKLAAQQNRPWDLADEYLQKASAWTKYDKAPAFQQIAEQKQQRQANQYNMALQSAAFNAQQKAALRDYQNTFGLGGVGGANVDQVVASMPPEYQRLWNLAKASGDANAARAILAKWAAIKGQSDVQPGWLDQIQMVITAPGTSTPVTVSMSKRDAEIYRTTGKLPADIKPLLPQKAVGGHIRSYSNGSSVDAPVEPPSPLRTAAENVISALTGSGSAEAAPAERGFGPTVQPVKPVAPPVASVSVSSPSGTPMNLTPQGILSQQESGQRQAEATHQAQLESTKKAREVAGQQISKIVELASRVDDVVEGAQGIREKAKAHPEDFGIHLQTDVPGYALGLVHDIPYVGQPLEDLRAKVRGGSEATSRRAAADSDANKMGIEYAKAELTGGGIRPGAELFRRAAEAKGVGVNLPAETNIYNSYLIEKDYRKAADQAAAWSQYKKKYGATADPHEFLNSEENRKIVQYWDNWFKKNAPYKKTEEQDNRPPLESFKKTK